MSGTLQRNKKHEEIKKIFDARVSTFQWVNQLSSSRLNHETVLRRFEQNCDQLSSNIDPNADPVNILCIGGGGMKGKHCLHLNIQRL